MRLITTSSRQARPVALPAALAALLAVGMLGTPTVDIATAATAAIPFDFNGDGVVDLAAGQPGAEEGGPGRVVVRYGTGTGFGTDETVLQHPRAADGNERFGSAVASADVDRDGYADLVVGASGFYADRSAYGSVTVFRGSPDGLHEAGASTVAWPRRADGDLVSFGASVVIADLDSDGWPDLAVGAPDDDGDPVPDRSVVAELWGSPAGFDASRATTIAHPAGARWFGELLAAGDVNADGHPDLLESNGSSEPGPHLSFLPGTATGPHPARVVNTGGATSIAVGEVTGDRYPDVVVGRAYDRYAVDRRKPYVGSGRVLLLRGSATGPRSAVGVTQDSPGVPGRGEYGDFFGQAVAVVDVNRNGRSEVVVGVPGEDVGSGSAAVREAGSVVLLRVGPTSFRHHGNRVLTQASPGVPGSVGKRHGFGWDVSGFDLTGDGVRDVLVQSSSPSSTPDPMSWLHVLPVTSAPLGTAAGRSLLVPGGGLPRDTSSAVLY